MTQTYTFILTRKRYNNRKSHRNLLLCRRCNLALTVGSTVIHHVTNAKTRLYHSECWEDMHI